MNTVEQRKTIRKQMYIAWAVLTLYIVILLSLSLITITTNRLTKDAFMHESEIHLSASSFYEEYDNHTNDKSYEFQQNTYIDENITGINTQSLTAESVERLSWKQNL